MISSNEASDAFTSKIQQLVASVKQNTQMKMKYMEYERQRAYDLEEGREQGLKEGRNSKAKEDAIALLKEGISEEVISRCINIPLEDVIELKKELEAK